MVAVVVVVGLQPDGGISVSCNGVVGLKPDRGSFAISGGRPTDALNRTTV